MTRTLVAAAASLSIVAALTACSPTQPVPDGTPHAWGTASPSASTAIRPTEDSDVRTGLLAELRRGGIEMGATLDEIECVIEIFDRLSIADLQLLAEGGSNVATPPTWNGVVGVSM